MIETVLLGGVFTSEDGTELPLAATVSGTWAFMTTHNGSYQYIQFQAVEGEQITIPTKLVHAHSYNFKLYLPDNSIFNDTPYNMVVINKDR